MEPVPPYRPRAYDDADTPATMTADCMLAASHMKLPRRTRDVSAQVLAEPPSIAYEDFPAEIAKREITVSDAAAALAAGLHLHLD